MLFISLFYILLIGDLKKDHKKYEFSYDLPSNSKLLLSSPNASQLRVTKSPNQKLKIILEIEADAENKEFLENLPENPKVFFKRGNKIDLTFDFIIKHFKRKRSTSFFEKLMGKIFSGEGSISINGKRFIAKDGVYYEVLSHFVKLRVEIPEAKEIQIVNKYGELELKSLKAKKIKVDAYESELALNSLSGDIDIKSKYAPVTIEGIKGNLESEFYESTVSIKNVFGKLNLVNKYDKTHIQNIEGKARIKCYESELLIENVEGELLVENKYKQTIIREIKSNSKLNLYESDLKIRSIYSNLELKNKYGDVDIESISGELDIDLYECDKIKLSAIDGNIKGKAKYGNLSVNGAKNIELELYELDSFFENTQALELNSKYSKLSLKDIKGDVDITNYEGDEIKILATKSFAKSILINSKYSEIRLLSFNYDNFRVRAKVKDAKIKSREFAEDLDDDDKSFKYQWRDKKRPQIIIDSYDGDIHLD